MSLEKLETIFSYEPETNNSNNLNYNFDNLVEIRFSYNPQEYNHSQSIWFVPYIVLVIIIVKFGSQNDSSNYFKTGHISDVSFTFYYSIGSWWPLPRREKVTTANAIATPTAAPYTAIDASAIKLLNITYQ